MKPEPLLRVNALGHRFEGARDGRFALQSASLELFPGEVVAIVGESGSGKTTLLGCIAGRIAPTEGAVQYRDAEDRWLDVHTMSERERRVLARTQWGFVGVARLLAHRTLVMRDGRIVEQGLTDRVLDDPQHAYTQLLVSSVVMP
jgi:putative phosphonate transport system ATP-binding protein